MSSGEAPSRLLGAVLAGGESRRFGRDKTAEKVGGVPMIERAVESLAAVCGEVVVVSSRSATPTGRWRMIPDLRPGEGPLAGLEAALVEAGARGYDGTLVLAADLPLVDGTTLARLVEALGDDHAVAATARAEGGASVEADTASLEAETASTHAHAASVEAEATGSGVQPLCAVYRVGCVGPVGRLLDEGRRDARALLEAVGGRTVEVDPGVLANVNTPEALVRVEETLDRAAAGGGGRSREGEA